MNRNDFLKSIGFYGSSLMAVYCSGIANSCTSANIEDLAIKKQSKNDTIPGNDTLIKPIAENTVPGVNTVTGKVYDVDFTIDLSKPDYTNLNSIGGYISVNKIVIARIKNGDFAAVTIICSHEDRDGIYYVAKQDIFKCSVHEATYDTQGNGLNAKGINGIKAYNTSLNGTALRVYG